MQECSPEHLHMGTARLKQDKETKFSLVCTCRVTSALARIAISHRIHFCTRVVALSEKEVKFSMAIKNENSCKSVFSNIRAGEIKNEI